MVSITDAGEIFGKRLMNGTVKLIIKRDGVEIFNRDFTAKYESVPELTVDQRLTLWAKNIRSQMQDTIYDFVREQNLFTNAKLATAITGIQTSLDVTGLGA